VRLILLFFHFTCFAAVNESKNRGWWLPAGHVDRGQTFVEAAIRETIEEAGINVILKGVLAVEHTLMSDRACRMRVIFYAEPNDPNQTPKTIPDKESNGAAWLTLEEIEAKRNFRPPEGLRGEELLRWGNYLKNGGLIAPMSVSTDGSYEGFFRNEDSGPSLSSPITSLSQPTPPFLGCEPNYRIQVLDSTSQSCRRRELVLCPRTPLARCGS
jgi:ADP-ribose pyrophosphatase YjhB (NUDIX family)